MKNRLDQKLLLKILVNLVFLCFGLMMHRDLMAQKILTDPQTNTKKRRISKQQRLKMNNKKVDDDDPADPPSSTAASLVSDTPSVENSLQVQTDASRAKLSIPQSELAAAFLQKEDTEAHLLRNPQMMRPREAVIDTTNTISVNLDKTELTNLLQWIESIFKIKFLSGDSVNPPGPGKVSGNLISYKTHKPMTKKELWISF